MTGHTPLRLVGLALALGTILVLAGCVTPDATVGLSDRQHAETTATLADNGTLSVSVTEAHNATKVEVSRADGYPVTDPRDEELVETFVLDGDGTPTATVPFDEDATVIIRSYVGGGEIRTTNVYRLHADGGHVADLYGNNTVQETRVNPNANFVLDRVDERGNNTTYRVVWVHASVDGQLHPGISHGITRADRLKMQINDGSYSPDSDEVTLDHIGDSYEVTVNRSAYTETHLTVIGDYNGKQAVITSVTLPTGAEACARDDDEFETHGMDFDIPDCQPLTE